MDVREPIPDFLEPSRFCGRDQSWGRVYCSFCGHGRFPSRRSKSFNFRRAARLCRIRLHRESNRNNDTRNEIRNNGTPTQNKATTIHGSLIVTPSGR